MRGWLPIATNHPASRSCTEAHLLLLSPPDSAQALKAAHAKALQVGNPNGLNSDCLTSPCSESKLEQMDAFLAAIEDDEPTKQIA